MIVYTANIGNYDKLQSAPNVDGVRFICFTDNDTESIPSYLGWEHVRLDYEPLTPRMLARKVKCLGHEYLQELNNDSGYVWVDSNIELLSTRAIELFQQILDKYEFATFKHPSRGTVQEEFDYLAEIEKYPKVLVERTKDYIVKNYGGPSDIKLKASGVVVRRSSIHCANVSWDWWGGVEATGGLDQEILSCLDTHMINHNIYHVPLWRFHPHVIKNYNE